MDAATLTQMIGSLGFPIVACIALFIDKKEERQQRQKENEKFTEAINNNTLAMTKLIDRIDCNKGV